MNILVIHEVSYLKKVVYDYHMLAEAMSLRGHDVYAIDYESMWKRNGHLISHRDEVLVNRVFPKGLITLIRPPFIKIPILSRATASLTHNTVIAKTMKEKEIDCVILYSVPTNGLQAVHWAKKFNIPIIFRSLDVLSQLVKGMIIQRVTSVMERKVYSTVDLALTITPKLSYYMLRMGAREAKVLNMPVDTTSFYPYEVDRKEFGFERDDKIILFMGTLFNFCGLDMFIRKMPLIIRKVPKAKLLIVGDGEQRRKLDSMIGRLCLRDRVTITGFKPYQDMPKYLNIADVCINPFMINNTTKDIFPGKTVQFLACGKPLVMTQLEGVKAVIDGEEQGVVYVDGIDSMASAVVSLLKSPKQLKQLGLKGLEYTRKHHDAGNIAGQLEEIIGGLKR